MVYDIDQEFRKKLHESMGPLIHKTGTTLRKDPQDYALAVGQAQGMQRALELWKDIVKHYVHEADD